jgi:hypothetical protein
MGLPGTVRITAPIGAAIGVRKAGEAQPLKFTSRTRKIDLERMRFLKGVTVVPALSAEDSPKGRRNVSTSGEGTLSKRDRRGPR